MSSYFLILVFCSVRPGYSVSACERAADGQLATRSGVNCVYHTSPHESPLLHRYHLFYQVLAYLNMFISFTLYGHTLKLKLLSPFSRWGPCGSEEKGSAQRICHLLYDKLLHQVSYPYLRTLNVTFFHGTALLPSTPIRHRPALSSLVASQNQGWLLLLGLYCFSSGPLLQIFDHSAMKALTWILVLYTSVWERHLYYMFQEML